MEDNRKKDEIEKNLN